jgi:hypothetical protein
LEKTKLGIPVGVFAAIIYFVAVIGGYNAMIFLLVAVAYVLLKEENQWLKKAVFKALAIFLAYYVFVELLGLFDSILSLPSTLTNGKMKAIVIPFNFINIIESLLSLVRYALLLFLGFSAFKQKDLPIASIDNVLN